MKATQRFIFVNENNYKQASLPTSDSITPNIVQRNVKDRFRQVIGNYWFARKPNGIPEDPNASFVAPKSTLAWQEKKTFPFKVKLGSTHTFSTYKTLPTVMSITPVTLVADDVFGAYPSCMPCWFRYLYGYDMDDPTLTVEKVFGFEPLKIQDIESFFTISPLAETGNPLQKQKLGAVTPLSMLLLTDAGLPTTERLSQIGIDVSYLSFGQALVQAIQNLTSGFDSGASLLSYNAKVFRDSSFDNEIAVLTEVEQSIESNLDFNLNATVTFVHNYIAREYDKVIQEDTLNLGLNEFGGETKLANMYENILNQKLAPTILKLRGELDCFQQNLVLFFRNGKYDSKVIYVLAETLPQINKFYPFQNLMPYYTQINFKLQATGPITAATEETRNDGLLMRHLQENSSVSEMNNFRTFKQSIATKRKSKKFLSHLVQENRDLLKSWGYYEWVLKLGERLSNIRSGNPAPFVVDPIPNDSIILNNMTKSATATIGGAVPFTHYLVSTAALHVKVADLIKFFSRSYPQLLKGEKPYKEVVAYKVVKYSDVNAPLVATSNEILDKTMYETLFGDEGVINTGNATPIQEFWFFNTSKEEVVNYIDTQIKSDRYYTYIVYAYMLVLENEYYYTNVGNTKLPCQEQILDFEPNNIPLIEKPLPSFPTPPSPSPSPTPAPPLNPVVTIPQRPDRGVTRPGFGQTGRSPDDTFVGESGLGPGSGFGGQG
jgi:hypothetical protein